MDLFQEIAALKSNAEDQLHALNTREKTKNALLLPFFSALGYNPFDVREVEPGFAVEVGEERRQVDYAVKRNGVPIMIFECKEAGTDLDAYDAAPLYRYFSQIEARIGVLTNGIGYRFYADLDREANADTRPFFEFNLLDHERGAVEELERLTKSAFDLDEILAAAHDLKYGRLLREYLERQWEGPDRQFVRFLAEQISQGGVAQGDAERFEPLVREALQQFVQGKEGEQPGSGSRDEASAHTGQPRTNGGQTAASKQTNDEQSSETWEEKVGEVSTAQEEADPRNSSPQGEADGRAPTIQNDEGPVEEQHNAETQDDPFELNGEDTFDTNLAERVIDDF